MGIFNTDGANKDGFTIVEILVVIVVIGILSSIVLVAYPAYQQRARDSERKSDMSQIAAALGAYAIQKNSYIVDASGCGLGGNGNGWFNAGPANAGAGSYPKALVTCLQEIGALGVDTYADPLNCIYDSGGICGTYRGNPVQAYMKATCKKGGTPITYMLTHLETAPRQDAVIDALCDSGSMTGYNATSQLWGTNYGMNYYVVVK